MRPPRATIHQSRCASLSHRSHVTIKAQVGYPHGVGETPEQPSFEVDGGLGVSYNPSGNGFLVNPGSINPRAPMACRTTGRGIPASRRWTRNSTLRPTACGTSATAGSRKSISEPASPTTSGRWMAGTAAAPLASTTPASAFSTMPFAAVNPTSYPSGLQRRLPGHPGLADPDRRRSGRHRPDHRRHPWRGSRADLRHQPFRTTTGSGARWCRRPISRATSWPA